MLRLESQPELVRRLVKEWLKSGDNCVPHELKYALQGSVNPETFKLLSRRIVERYEKGALTVHFHVRPPRLEIGELRSHVERNSDSAPYCAVAQFFASDKEAETSVSRNKIDIVSNDGDNVQAPVFIDVYESIQDSQRIIPTVVRLQSLDECSRLWGNPIEAFGSELRVLDSTLRNGEGIASTGNVGVVCDHQLRDDVVQGRTDVPKEITGDCADFGGCLWSEPNPLHEDLPFSVLLHSDAAFAFTKLRDQPMHLVKMFLCPDEFQVNLS